MFLRNCVKSLPLVAWLMFSIPAAGQPDSQLSAALVKHFMVLRNNYTDAHLTFDSDGKLTSAGTPGFGPIEGRIYVDGVRVESGSLLITASRPVDVYDESKNQLRPLDMGRKVTIAIALPNDRPPDAVIPALLEKVFFTSAEIDRMNCSADETKSFMERVQKSHAVHGEATHKKEPPAAEAQTLDELHSVCYPIGDHAFPEGKGVRPPKAVKAPDPYSSGKAESAHKAGVSVLMLIVDTNGKPTSFIFARLAGYGLDEAALDAVRTWIFKPATFHDQPVPVAIQVQVNFTAHN